MAGWGGIIAGAMEGLGNAGNQIADQYVKEAQLQKQNDNEINMAQLRAKLQEQQEKAILDYKNNLVNAPANDAGQYLSDAMESQTPVTAPKVTQTSGADPDSTFNKSGSGNADGKGLVGMTREQVMQFNDPEMLAQYDRQIAYDQSVADKSVEGKTRAPTTHEAIQAAMKAAIEDGNALAYEKLKALAGEKYVNLAESGTLNTATGEIIQPTISKAQRQAEHDKRIAESKLEIAKFRAEQGGGALPAEAANAEWLIRNGITTDPATAWKMAKKLGAGEHVGDTDTNTKVAELIASGKVKAETVLGKLPSSQKLSILAEASKINPDYQQKDYAIQQKTLNDFSTGTQGKAINSFNTSVEHLNQLGKLSDALENGNAQLLNKIGNAITTWSGGAAPVNFDAVKHIVAAELVKAVTGSGGALGDREALDKTLQSANSPAQLMGVVDQYKGLMIAQLKNLSLQYEANTGRKDFYKKLSPEARILSGINAPSDSTKQTGGVKFLGFE